MLDDQAQKTQLLETQLAIAQTEASLLAKNLRAAEENLVALESYTRRENLRFVNIPEEQGKDCTEVLDFIQNELKINKQQHYCTVCVPLGSIPELPAESCSEIKASEGNEMVNGDYWIYSDGNGQTILARCEENWQKMNTEPVCFGARGNQYGAFNITKSGRLKTMKLIHKSGSVKCNSVDSASYWGCRNSENYGNNGLLTIIINAKKESVLPPAEDLKAHNHCDKKKHFYSLDGTYHTSPELVFRDLPNLLYVSRNQEFQIWYGKDWIDCWESGNSGKTCVDVYAWFV
ncbi:hypothetical protein ACROYT_G018294 [Oculina patagonica]